MSRKEGQKLKLLTLIRILMRETDEKHPMSVPRLVERLRDQGIQAERKSIYADIETLKELPGTPFDIIQRRGRGGGYYMTDTPFELPELKLLVDAVYTSKFITARKTKTLIDKLGRFTSQWQQEELDRQVQVSGRIKSQDEAILYTVDTLHSAITAGVQVRFKYCDWTLEKKMKPRHDGRFYQVSPWTLVWENGNYYLIAYTEGMLRHYRVDKMQRAEALPDAHREGADAFASFDVNTYTQQLFDMFNGPVKQVTLRCENRLAGAMFDRFGTRPTPVICPGGDRFEVTVAVQVSPRFYGWVAGFAGAADITAPADVRAEMKRVLDTLQEQYR